MKQIFESILRDLKELHEQRINVVQRVELCESNELDMLLQRRNVHVASDSVDVNQTHLAPVDGDIPSHKAKIHSAAWNDMNLTHAGKVTN